MDKVRNLLFTAVVLILASIASYLFDLAGFTQTNIAFVYLLAVLLVVWQSSSLLTGVYASVAATFVFNYLFVPPRFTLAVYEPNAYITFLALIITSTLVSTLTTRARRETKLAREREMETRSIYMLVNQLSDAGDMESIQKIAVEAVCDGLQCGCGCLCLDDEGQPEPSFVFQPAGEHQHQVRRETEDPKAILFRIQHPSDERFEGEEFWDWTLYGGEGPLGVIRIPWEDMGTMDQDRKRLLHSMIDSIALAMDRFRAAEQRIKSREEVSRERYRANLLRSISHDIRTPLAGIIGCSEILRDSLDSAEEPYRIAGRIQKDAEWLHSLVENIMGLTRLQDGGVKLKKEWEAVEEIIGGAVAHVEQHWTDREIDVRLPEKVLMAPMDAKLIEQVNINLLENAMKHSRDSGPVMITASEDKATHSVVVTVRDSGEGIRSQDLPHIFQPFYTSGRSESTKERSFGLGLAICETIVHAHGGTIQARNRADGGGAEFTYTIPMEVHDDKENRKDTGR